MTTRQGLNPEKFQASLERLQGMMVAAHVSAMICLGLRLGLYGALKDAGPVTSEDVAGVTGLHERWVREWLRGQATAGVIDYRGDGRFELSAEAAILLGDEDHVMFLGVYFDNLPHAMDVVERLPETFRTGLGLSWDDRGPEAAAIGERILGNWYRQVLVPGALPTLEGVVAKLKAGAKVADVGCGSGIALIEMAKAFPQSEFCGYEISEHALARAEANRRQAGTPNVAFHNVANEPLPADGRFDLIVTFDCLHEMTRPEQVAAAIRAAMSADGTWFIVDINCAPTLEENLTNPLAPLLYAFSILACMSSGLSEPGGAGLGTLGLPEPAMRELVNGAGFSRFRRLDLPHPANAHYEARP
jgi:2-polyprenyl-3-methyl-5-hydroxy-6-metoxy-1,4-benzoquinol methylase